MNNHLGLERINQDGPGKGERFMEMPYFYETEVEWRGEKRGEMRSSGLPSVEVAAPPEFKGHENRWTPEHLFVAAVNSCFMTTFLAIAELSRLEFMDFKASATGKLDKVEGRGLAITEITIRPRLTLPHDRDVERARKVLEKAERHCLISNSINSKVALEPEIAVQNAEALLVNV